ncbi:MAG: cytochrome c3 family protein [Planctomycetaceae bacterium]
MANTLASVADASPIEVIADASTEFEDQGCRYRVERLGDRLIHTEFMTDADGKLVYEQSEDVHYAVGSGTRTYLIDRGGILFESPITWYADKRKWDLSPGYHENPRQRFNRRVSDGCVQCHSGHAAFTGDGTSNRFEEQPFRELGIGCERCHGPGKRHVERFEADDWDTDNDSADDMLIVNPARLDRHLEDSVCYQCHMDGKHRILRKGKSFHDFRSGMATEDIWTVFVSRAPFEADGTAPFTSQVEQMHSSACFRGSEGRMRCTTCHDPHRSPDPGERAAFYRERCNSCHSDQGCSLPMEQREPPPAFNSCIHCHMPMAGSSDIPHTSHSDHRVLREPRNDPDVVDRSNQGVVWSIFDDSNQRMPEWEVQRARALALCEQAIEDLDQSLMGQAVVALQAVLARDANDVDVLRKLGFLYGAAHNYAKARSSFEAALHVEPHDELSLKNLGLMALRTRSLDIARRSYEEYLKVNNWDATMYEPYVRILAASGDLQAALEAAERGLRLDPTQRGLRGIAAKLHGRIGDQKKSLQHREILEVINNRLEPWDQKRRDRKRIEMQKSLQQD